jgi:hypothetical protein
MRGREAAGGNREALSLAAAAALDKGVELDPAALEEYAAAIEVEARLPEPPDSKAAASKQDADNQGGNGGTGGGNAGSQGEAGHNTDSRRGHDQDAERDIAALAGNPRGLKEKMLESGEANPLLDLLNRLPGKNGQRWIVLPFHFVEAGALYRICLRILLNSDQSAGHLVLDVLRTEGEPRTCGQNSRRRLFVMERTNGKNSQLRVYLESGVSKKARRSLIAELAACMGLAEECISIHNGKDFSPLAEHNPKDILRSINEEV